VTAPRARRPFDWEAAGEELGDTLSSYHMVVVAGLDSVTTGQVAVGVARAQSLGRRVAVGDLFGESPPIRELISTDDPHGIVDSFLYGVSLSRIAYPVPGAGQLFAMQSGTEPPNYEEILANPRWHRLCGGFREADALLVLAVPANAPRLEELVGASDGAVLVGDVAPPGIPFSRVISSIREPGRQTLAAMEAVPEPPAEPAKPDPFRRFKSAPGILLTLVLVAVALWLAYRPLASSRRPIGHKRDSTQGINTVIAGADSTPPADTTPAAQAATVLPRVANPGDSANAAVYGVELIKANTQAGAILKLQRDGKKMPAATFAPVVIQGARWFNVVSGAFANQTDAESLLVNLRRQNVLDAGRGTVVRVPYAFLIDSVKNEAVPGLISTYADHGEPVYALRQTDGTAWLLVGAFESLDQAAGYSVTLRASGITPVLVYRKGRTF
jgi:hypothetical protein